MVASLARIGAGDLGDAEAADDLEGEGHPRVARHGRLAADEDHAELVVERLVVWVDGGVAGGQSGRPAAERLLLAGEVGVAPQEVERAVLRHLHQPAAGVVRHAAEGPGAQRLDQRLLDHVLGEPEVLGAEQAGEDRDHPPRLAAEQMVDELRHLGGHRLPRDRPYIASIWRSSIQPLSRCGHPLAISAAAP